jgi:hypothetical protein
MIQFDFTGISLKLKKEHNTVSVFDFIRKKWIVLTPEEQVRQYLSQYLIHTRAYPSGMIAVEKKIIVGKMAKRFDLVIYDRKHNPWMLIECKAPDVDLSERTLHQLLQYQRALPCRYWVLSNGHRHFCADAVDPQQVVWLQDLPLYEL